MFRLSDIEGNYPAGLESGSDLQISAILDLIYIRLIDFLKVYILNIEDLLNNINLMHVQDKNTYKGLLDLINTSLIAYIEELDDLKKIDDFSNNLKSLLTPAITVTPKTEPDKKVTKILSFTDLDLATKLKLIVMHREVVGLYNLADAINSLLFESPLTHVKGIFKENSFIYFIYYIIYEIFPTCIDKVMIKKFKQHLSPTNTYEI